MATLAAESLDALNSFLPKHWSHGNPIDILGDADPERYQRAAEIALADPNSDGLLVILAPQGMTNPADVAERLKPHAHAHGKPLLASWMGAQAVAARRGHSEYCGNSNLCLSGHRRPNLHPDVALYL